MKKLYCLIILKMHFSVATPYGQNDPFNAALDAIHEQEPIDSFLNQDPYIVDQTTYANTTLLEEALLGDNDAAVLELLKKVHLAIIDHVYKKYNRNNACIPQKHKRLEQLKPYCNIQ